MILRFLPLLLILAGSLRIASTWTSFTQTIDEPFHIACGVQWWVERIYERELQHPPLARTAIGSLLAANGARIHQTQDSISEGNAVLLDGGYWRNLRLARLPILPFYWLACFSVWSLGRRLYGERAGIYALAIFSVLPPILGHAGIATTDLAAAATFAFSVDRFHAWFIRPSVANVAWAGFALGLAASTKFSNLLYVGLSVLVLIAIYRRWQPLILAIPIALFVISATYRFHKEFPGGRTAPLPPGATLSDRAANLADRVSNLQSFWVQYAKGIGEVRKHNEEGHWTYLLGRTYVGGDWRFFPVALAVKTPIAVLLLFALGVRRRTIFSSSLALLFLLALLPVNINLGVRHALHIYVPMALTAGYALTTIPRRAAAVLGLWLIINSATAHPNYLAWFNEIVQSRPERLLAESDLDWGQDLPAVVRFMDANGIAQCYLSYWGTAPQDRIYPGRFRTDLSNKPQDSHCLAVSVRHLSLDRMNELQQGHADPWKFLEALPPPVRAGRSMLVYRLP
jgi:hypothetical protein